MAELMANDDACERLDKEDLQRVEKAKERFQDERMPLVTEVQKLASGDKQQEASGSSGGQCSSKHSVEGTW